MNILKPNLKSREEDSNVVLIPKNEIYVYVTDYETKFLLKEVIVSIGTHKWVWLPLTSASKAWDLYDSVMYDNFEDAINRKVNDIYITLYRFRNFEQFIRDYNNVKYNDIIKTKFKLEDKKGD